MNKAKLIIVDDDHGIRNFVRNVSEELGYEVGEAETVDEFIELFKEMRVEVIVLDIVMPEKHGLELLDFIHEYHPKTKLMFLTGHGDVILNAAIRLAEKKGINVIGGLFKPVKLEDIQNTLIKALPQRV